MGVNLKDLFERSEIKIEDLSGKIIAIDSFNMIFQFLSTIRARDGNLLKNSKGGVTSHLIGLFSRTTSLMSSGIKPVFVFDGVSPILKRNEQMRRHQVKEQAEERYAEAQEVGNFEDMKKYAARTSRLNEEMINDAKKLISLLGLPVVEAPSEGEAQASHIVKSGNAWAVASQDYDSLVNGAPKLIQNLSISSKRKNPKTLAYTTISPQIIELESNLKRLNINQDQLIMLSMLVGTDYNPGGIKGIGPKNALKLVLEHKTPKELFEFVSWDKKSNVNWQDVWNTIKNMEVTDKYVISFNSINESALKKFLIDEHDFGAQRVESAIKNLVQKQEQKKQAGLSGFF